MSELENKTISRNYVFTQKELKKQLGIEGDIKEMGLWAGLTPTDDEAGKSHDTDEWAISTTEEVKG